MRACVRIWQVPDLFSSRFGNSDPLSDNLGDFGDSETHGGAPAAHAHGVQLEGVQVQVQQPHHQGHRQDRGAVVQAHLQLGVQHCILC